MFDAITRLTGVLENGAAAALAMVVGPDGLGLDLMGRKLLVHPDGSSEGSLGAKSLDARVTAECRLAMVEAPHTRYLSLKLSDEERTALKSSVVGELDVFVEAIQPTPVLLIVGAGHIAQPLSRIGKMLGFQVTVIDDRPSFANASRFPEADRVVSGYLGEELDRQPINRSTYIVLVTRGHAQDEQSLRQVIDSEAAYIGMIGSRRRVGVVLQRMAEDGFSEELIGKVYSPIGLDIGAETPEEIAVSIIGEVISVRRRGSPHPSSLSADRKRRSDHGAG